MKLWTSTYEGDVHRAAATINTQDPRLAWSLLSLVSADGRHTTAMFKVSDEFYQVLTAERVNPRQASQGEPIVLSGGADGVVFSLEDGQ